MSRMNPQGGPRRPANSIPTQNETEVNPQPLRLRSSYPFEDVVVPESTRLLPFEIADFVFEVLRMLDLELGSSSSNVPSARLGVPLTGPSVPPPPLIFPPAGPSVPPRRQKESPRRPSAPPPGLGVTPPRLIFPPPGLGVPPQRPSAPPPGLDLALFGFNVTPPRLIFPPPGLGVPPQRPSAPPPGLGLTLFGFSVTPPRLIFPPPRLGVPPPRPSISPSRRSVTPPGLSVEVIMQHLKRENFVSVDGDNPNEKEHPCAVCQEDFKDEEEIVGLDFCVHKYHVQCIQNWLLSTNQCPLCRRIALNVNA